MTSAAPAPQPPPRAPSALGGALKSFLSGGAGGICLVLAGHPFDLVKTLLQTSPPGTYSSAAACVGAVLRRNGPRGLYRGMAAPLAGVAPIFALCFLTYDGVQAALRQARGLAPGAALGLGDVGLAGAASALPTTLIMAPGERIKCVLQVRPELAGPRAALAAVLADGGLRSLYRGAAATLARDGLGSVAYFAVYERLTRRLTAAAAAASGGGSGGGGGGGAAALSPLAIIAAGGIAGVCNWLVALPLDVVKSRIQTADVLRAAGAPRASGRMLDVARAVVAERGIAGLYRGAGPALARAFPANAACFLGMEQSKRWLESWDI